uniref:Homeobox protein 13-like n=1 Tax=Dermatophagoides pteronyssinus TaxID=6956 RepID=A0A6P6XYW8_DERPT|nr:homeobox protein 13-like [Dermatophagoides pteronyssinus]
MFSKLFNIIIMMLMIIIIGHNHCINCQPLLSSTNDQTPSLSSSSLLSSTTTNSCQENIKHCSLTSLDRLSCTKIKQLKQCLDNLKHICHGSIHYHSISSFVDHKSIDNCRIDNNHSKQNQNKNQNHNQNKNRRRQRNRLQNPNHQSSTQRPPIRSMYPPSPPESSNHQAVKSGVHNHHHHGHHRKNPLVNVPLSSSSSSLDNDKSVNNKNHNKKPEYFQYCLQAAYNFTIGLPLNRKNFNEINHHYQQQQQRYKRQESNMDLMYFSHNQQQRYREKSINNHNNRNNRLNETTVQLATELIYKPIHPMTPSLTCIIFGDPHLRTFDSKYQTCNCLGTRSMLEHPLFDVQITNSKIFDQFNSTGVTKVTVLIRRFNSCMITQELIYETDSLAQASPAGTFTDGSIYNFKNLVYITTSMKDMVVTIHLEHIGARVYISQFIHTKFLNVVIKFLTSKSNLVRQDLVLDAINPISLCKSGCYHRELIDIESELKLADINPESSTIVRQQQQQQESPLPNFSNNLDDDDDQDDNDDYDAVDDNDNDEDDYDDNDDEDDGEDYDGYSDSDNDSNSNRKRRRTQKRDVHENSDGPSVNNEQQQQRRLSSSNRKRQDRRKGRNRNRTSTTSTTTTTTELPKKLRKSKPKHQQRRINRLRSALEKYPQNPNQNNDDLLTSISQLRLDDSGNMNVGNINDIQQQNIPENIDNNNDNIILQDCYEKNLIGYYRLSCLYDTMIKGSASTLPFVFASSFDEPKFMTLDQHNQHFGLKNYSVNMINNNNGQQQQPSSGLSSKHHHYCCSILTNIFWCKNTTAVSFFFGI